MKTLKTLLVTAFFTVTIPFALAQDIASDGIFYNITSDVTVKVTSHPLLGGYQGTVMIPSMIN